MKIDAGNNYLHTSQRTQLPAVNNDASSSATAPNSVGTSKSETTTTQQVDFSNMTSQEMLSWVNTQIRSGEMSLDDSRAFMAMSIRIPVDGGTGSELPVANDNERFNFMQKARDGIDAALSRNDKETLKMLESAIFTMQKYQGQTIGIDARA